MTRKTRRVEQVLCATDLRVSSGTCLEAVKAYCARIAADTDLKPRLNRRRRSDDDVEFEHVPGEIPVNLEWFLEKQEAGQPEGFELNAWWEEEEHREAAPDAGAAGMQAAVHQYEMTVELLARNEDAARLMNRKKNRGHAVKKPRGKGRKAGGRR